MQPLLTQFCQPLPFSLLGHCDTTDPHKLFPLLKRAWAPARKEVTSRVRWWQTGLIREHYGSITSTSLLIPLAQE